MSQLIILGNGFDLTCGLNSRYSDFFENRLSEEQIEIIFSSYQAYKECLEMNQSRSISYNISKSIHELFSNITIWDLIFHMNKLHKDVNWCDVENIMDNFLNNTDTNKNINIYIKDIEHALARRGKKIDIKTITSNHVSEEMYYAYFIVDFYETAKHSISNYDLPKFFMDELRILEHAFSYYLIKSSGYEAPEYKNRSIALLKKIKNSPEESPLENCNILNFNYTSPIIENNYNRIKLQNMVHVHGSLEDDNIIFGIDQNRIPSNSPAYSFTKTYRKFLSMKSYQDENHSPLLKRDTKQIKFFGHSLSQLDYSYFQSIFDFYNIYDNNIQLFFFYTIYDQNLKENIKNDFINSVVTLISDYGESLDNKDHGKNLIHKLMLENRILIEEIKR